MPLMPRTDPLTIISPGLSRKLAMPSSCVYYPVDSVRGLLNTTLSQQQASGQILKELAVLINLIRTRTRAVNIRVFRTDP